MSTLELVAKPTTKTKTKPRSIPHRQTLAKQYPQHISQVVDPANLKLRSGSQVEIEFRCPTCATVETTRVGNRTRSWDRGNTGCGACFRSHGTIATECPDHVDEVVDPKNLQLQAQSNLLIEFRCPKCHQVTTSQVYQRTRAWTKGGTGCGIIGCSGRGTLLDEYPDHAAELLDPQDLALSAKCKVRVKFICPLCNSVAVSRVCDRTAAWDRSRNGCSCLGWSFNIMKPGWLYLAINEVAGLLQVGITNDLPRRMYEHSKSGFSLLDSERYELGLDAKDLETKAKVFLRSCLGHSLNERINGEVFSGFTEAWKISELSITSLAQLLALMESETLVLTSW